MKSEQSERKAEPAARLYSAACVASLPLDHQLLYGAENHQRCDQCEHVTSTCNDHCCANRESFCSVSPTGLKLRSAPLNERSTWGWVEVTGAEAELTTFPAEMVDCPLQRGRWVHCRHAHSADSQSHSRPNSSAGISRTDAERSRVVTTNFFPPQCPLQLEPLLASQTNRDRDPLGLAWEAVALRALLAL